MQKLLDDSAPPHPDPFPEGEGEQKRARRRFFAFVKWTLFLVVLVFVFRSLATQFGLIDWNTVHFKPLPIVLATVCLLLVPPVQLISYRTLLGAYAQAPPWRVMAAVAWIPPLGKYVPGKVASLIGAVYILRQFQIPAAIALSVVLVMDGLAVVSGLITGAPLLRTVLPNNGWMIAAAVIGIGIVSLHPAVFGRLLNFVLIRLKREPLERMPDLQHYLVPVLCAFGQWVLAGVALWLLTSAVMEISIREIPRFVSIAGLGYTISYLMLFAPGGLGPRELIFQQLMLPYGPLTAVAVVVMRIIQTLTELSAALVGMVLLRRLRRLANRLPGNLD